MRSESILSIHQSAFRSKKPHSTHATNSRLQTPLLLAEEGTPGVVMTSEQFQLVKELYVALQPLSAEERQHAIKARCGNDSAVRAELERLLDRADEAYLVSPARREESAPVKSRAREMTGRRVGPYQVIETLGQGGWAWCTLPTIRAWPERPLSKQSYLERSMMPCRWSACDAKRACWHRCRIRISQPCMGLRNRRAHFFLQWSTSRANLFRNALGEVLC